MDGALLTTQDAAALLRVNPETLKVWRARGGGPRFAKLGRRVLYRQQDLEDFVARNLRASTSDPGAAGKRRQ
jgi:DNA-binding transcriptional MerR regulator